MKRNPRFTRREIGDACAVIDGVCDRIRPGSGVDLRVDWLDSFRAEEVVVSIRSLACGGDVLVSDRVMISILEILRGVAFVDYCEEMLRDRSKRVHRAAATFRAVGEDEVSAAGGGEGKGPAGGGSPGSPFDPDAFARGDLSVEGTWSNACDICHEATKPEAMPRWICSECAGKFSDPSSSHGDASVKADEET